MKSILIILLLLGALIVPVGATSTTTTTTTITSTLTQTDTQTSTSTTLSSSSAMVIDWKFDIGGPMMSGWTSVQNEAYAASPGWGWNNTALGEIPDRGAGIGATYFVDMFRGFEYKGAPFNAAFRVDLPNGVYQVACFTGDAYQGKTSFYADGGGGTQYLGHFDYIDPTNVWGAVNGTVTVTQGYLMIRPDGTGSTDGNWRFNGLEIMHNAITTNTQYITTTITLPDTSTTTILSSIYSTISGAVSSGGAPYVFIIIIIGVVVVIVVLVGRKS